MRKKIVGLVVLVVLGIGSTFFTETFEASSKPDIDPINVIMPDFM